MTAGLSNQMAAAAAVTRSASGTRDAGGALHNHISVANHGLPRPSCHRFFNSTGNPTREVQALVTL